MLFVRACQTILLTAALVAAPAFAERSHRTPTSGHSKKKPVSHKVQGQRGIDPDRAREIQSALIKQNYLSGEPSGQWDSETQTAMQKFQSDNGWQTKLTPDSRALIKLGLGPDHTGTLPTTAKSVDAPQTKSPPSVAEANTLASAHSIQN
ncbi:peptidoglycan-binding protein [Alloacidobacterium dinghuense]|uniref:Peptidoglycan-binding protein n=1 Tax=Alloacidobacterium dinghuense TaxID=2763107 RepID=A0A7G8BNB1_9BACT|nr:peptidoglycan-binding domain-containing protein [Alloacidobacterium dinghuense]QNI34031.1 peptidoglycan-binding protein [Alloacidobacterium dinghuense]